MSTQDSQPPAADTVDRVRRYIVDELGWTGPELTPDFPLLENRVIDSLGLFRIVAFLEEQYGVKIRDDRLVPVNFSSLNRIAHLVEQSS